MQSDTSFALSYQRSTVKPVLLSLWSQQRTDFVVNQETSVKKNETATLKLLFAKMASC